MLLDEANQSFRQFSWKVSELYVKAMPIFIFGKSSVCIVCIYTYVDRLPFYACQLII